MAPWRAHHCSPCKAGSVLFRTAYKRWLDTAAELDSGHIIGAVLADQRGHRDRLVIPGGRIANVAGPRAPLRRNFATNFPESLPLDGFAAIAGDQCDHGVERGFERLGVALDLSQQQAALQGGEGGEGEPVGIGLGGEPAELVHLP